MEKIKRIGVLTSGGDCAGLNAVISAVVAAASKKGWEVYGIHNGTDGITETPHSYEVLTVHNFSDSPWPRLSGSYLGSLNKGVKMESLEEMSKRFAQGVKDLGLDAIVVVGGDGSMNIVSNYCKGTDVRVIGIPKTIDNDTLTMIRRLRNFQLVFNRPFKFVRRLLTIWNGRLVHTIAL